jgi:hypothetical protein
LPRNSLATSHSFCSNFFFSSSPIALI